MGTQTQEQKSQKLLLDVIKSAGEATAADWLVDRGLAHDLKSARSIVSEAVTSTLDTSDDLVRQKILHGVSVS
ncbi:hypothetical protein YA0089_27350 [Pseudomonas viridiflava]|uniref:hypothetical protein n=1 Tax=Pseudomonas viridiflava TaxID=33069 RepID=UPI0018E62EAD|nr:hypothetical protein [Pseudomonas viridiflava]MBI6727336.1 hypothetical protein [Pseudomonas viridiflava]